MLVDLIVGARPNFIKIASIISAIKEEQEKGTSLSFRLIHTGQHYDHAMSESFFQQLNIPKPDFNLSASGGSQSEQVGSIMVRYENLIFKHGKPNACLVVGDVNSTMACAITAQKLNIDVLHVEGGIRSYDWKMPEEINRLVTDSITNYFFTTSEYANENLRSSGVCDKRIYYVGNTMIDTLIRFRHKFIKPLFFDMLPLQKGRYIVMTLHRPANVDNDIILQSIITEVLNNSENIKIIFPAHPRTQKVLEKIKIQDSRLFIIDPLSYFEFNFLVENCLAVITDSGGVTEETTFMGIPCITLRDNTERPETVEIGTNELIGSNPAAIKLIISKLISGNWKKGTIPLYWDGNAGKRIIQIIKSIYIK